MTSSTLFIDAMALTSSGDGVYHGVLNEHWTIGAKIHGGAMLALCANAARVEFAAGTDDSEVEPIAVSARSRTDRAGTSDGGYRAPGPRLRYRAVVDDVLTALGRRAAADPVLGTARGGRAGRAVRAAMR